MEQNSTNSEWYSCENCGIAPLETFEVPGQSLLWRCPACKLFQKGQPPTEEMYELTYHDDYLQAMPRKVRTAQVRLCRAQGFVENPAPTLLDVGCSIGATVTAAERRGWQAHGVDVSRTAVDSCRRRGLNCRHYDGGTLPYADETFDTVTAWHVIEHVTNVAATLDDWFRVLKPGGLLLLETPHAHCWKALVMGPRYKKFWPAAHIYTFTPRTLEPFALRSGFELLPTPYFVQPRNVGPTTTVFALAHQSYLAATRISGFCKAFQIFARRPKTAARTYRLAA